MLSATKQLKFKTVALTIIAGIIYYLGIPSPVYAVSPNGEIADFTSQTLTTLTAIAGLAATFFLVKGGYDYMTSSGKPDNLEDAKKTIRNALIGLCLVIGAGVISSLLLGSFNTPSSGSLTSTVGLTPIVPTKPADGLTQVLIDAITGFLQNIVQSATKPLVDGVISFLTSTPQILGNPTIWNFWLIMVGIVDALFALIIALLGLQFMSASTFGFEELEIKQLLPRIGLAFLGANASIFLADWIVLSCNKLTQAVLHATGGLDHAWVINAINPTTMITGTTALITVIFLLLFIILATVLLLFYISRLILISFGAAISPFIFLLWALPKTADFAEISAKSYIVGVYTVFVQVVIIQLASAFFSTPDVTGGNPIIAILVGVGLLFTLLKTPGTLMQLVFYTTSKGAVKKIGGQIMNVISSDSGSTTASSEAAKGAAVKVARRSVAI